MSDLAAPVPILRIFDEARARGFYCSYLGFEVVFEHRFEPGLPLYMEVRRDQSVLHLSEHHGDASPGAHIRMSVRDLDALLHDLLAKDYRHLRPGIIAQPWGMREMTLTDPFANRLTFCETMQG
ncbi:MAG: glyoxalase/bleomycin resistance/extradiol dioxygenase family protein [Phyllobacteriaceae bacterium]|nr:glyoxalase/bleomycin resistance/extradiol dioxygenase family protein [Phyllobacteriaceae bacterium]MBA91419.1 glyoxalase/bleomycin resistance/extradiol dioxygenase family protein [Phyllobacteriaceae bacterium]